MIYINCLTHHFKNLAPTTENSMAFTMFESDFGDYAKFKMNIQELHKAKLVSIEKNCIRFHNFWGQYIDRNLLDKEVASTASTFKSGPASALIDELKKEDQMIELCMMRNKISRKHTLELIDLFVKEQDAFKKVYTSLSDCMKHCTNWIGLNHQKTPKESIKSGAKILGKQ